MLSQSIFPNFGQGPFPKIAGKSPDRPGVFAASLPQTWLAMVRTHPRTMCYCLYDFFRFRRIQREGARWLWKERFLTLDILCLPGRGIDRGRGRGARGRGQYSQVGPYGGSDDFGPRRTPSLEFRDYRTPSGMFYCPLCDVTLTTESHMAQHAQSKMHKQKTLNQRYENMTKQEK